MFDWTGVLCIACSERSECGCYSIYTKTSISPGVSKLYSDSAFDYFKVAIAPSVTMVEGATTTACSLIGMTAVCDGQSGCQYNDESM